LISGVGAKKRGPKIGAPRQTRRQFGSDKRLGNFSPDVELELLFPSGQSIQFCCVESIGVFPHLCTSGDLQAPRGIGVLAAAREV